jgi:hypothetical protein
MVTHLAEMEGVPFSTSFVTFGDIKNSSISFHFVLQNVIDEIVHYNLGGKASPVIQELLAHDRIFCFSSLDYHAFDFHVLI